MHLRRKMKNEKQKPRHFEIMPPTGVLMPGQRLNVQVKFMPTEEVEMYSIQNYVIKFVSDLRQVGGFLRFPPPRKLTATI
jgi:hydrocephalus-inducing protein